jgi:death-on-curing protein
MHALGVIENHPFFDGNKRVGAVLLELFLEDNGYELDASDAEMLAAIMPAAAGETSEETFISWVRAHTRPSRQKRRK